MLFSVCREIPQIQIPYACAQTWPNKDDSDSEHVLWLLIISTADSIITEWINPVDGIILNNHSSQSLPN